MSNNGSPDIANREAGRGLATTLITAAKTSYSPDFRLANVVSVEASSITVEIGDAVPIPGVKHLGSYHPVAGEPVWIVDMGRGRWLAIGSTVAEPPIPSFNGFNVGCDLYMNSNWSHPGGEGSWWGVPWQNEVYDSSGVHDPGWPEYIFIPTGQGGLWTFGATFVGVGSPFGIGIYNVLANNMIASNSGSAGGSFIGNVSYSPLSVSVTMRVNAGDQFQIAAYQGAFACTLWWNIATSGISEQTRCYAHRIG